jgi:signal transduction histidine kinase/ActR/RegA family two-component response regulator
MAVPFVARDGRNLGVLQVFDHAGGDFTEEDEALAVQLAQMAAIAMENTLFNEAREANRLKDEFLATVSHELRTPLSAIRTWTWMLRRGDLKPEAVTKALEAIERNITAQTRIVDDLLEVSRIVTGKLRLRTRPLELGALVDAAVEAVLPDANGKGITLVRDLEPAPTPVLGDPERLQQVVWNLLSNAIKFTPRGGRIEVGTAHQEGEVTLTVRDTGKGISPSFLPHVFERFRQADGTSTRSAGGLGLGLAIVRHLVELHGGRVAAASDGEGKGATFTVTLPFAASRDAAALPAEAEETQSLDGVRVLLVEDDVDTREALALVLAEAGARVTSVGSAAEALASLTGSSPDVIVCDLGLPGEDGYALMRKLHGLGAGAGRLVPALALTAYAQERDRERALAAGFREHLAKPVSPATLLREVGRAVAERAEAAPRRALRGGGATVRPGA